MTDNRRYIENLQSIYRATYKFGRDTQGQAELRETIQAAIQSLKNDQNTTQEEGN